MINKNEKRFWFFKKLNHVPLIASPSQMFLMGSRDNQSSVKPSKGKNISGRSAGRIHEIEYHHKFGWYQWKSNEVFGWRFLSWNFFLKKLPRSIPVLTHVFSVDWSPHMEIYYKGIMMSFDEKGYLHDGVVSLMIVGLIRNRPYALHSIP